MFCGAEATYEAGYGTPRDSSHRGMSDLSQKILWTFQNIRFTIKIFLAHFPRGRTTVRVDTRFQEGSITAGQGSEAAHLLCYPSSDRSQACKKSGSLQCRGYNRISIYFAIHLRIHLRHVWNQDYTAGKGRYAKHTIPCHSFPVSIHMS